MCCFVKFMQIGLLFMQVQKWNTLPSVHWYGRWHGPLGRVHGMRKAAATTTSSSHATTGLARQHYGGQSWPPSNFPLRFFSPLPPRSASCTHTHLCLPIYQVSSTLNHVGDDTKASYAYVASCTIPVWCFVLCLTKQCKLMQQLGIQKN